MAFPKKQARQYPRRLWELVGRPGSGKSTFFMRMRGPLLPVDADHRIDEVAYLNDDMLELSLTAEDHNTPDRIAQLLNQNMPGSAIGTIGVDSLTAIIAPLVTQAMIDKDAGRTKNLYAGFKGKALAMRQLQDNITRWGTDVLWIYHLDDSTDAEGKAQVKATISRTELLRLMRSVNLRLQIVLENNRSGRVAAGARRGIKIVWARRGRSGFTLWDDSGTWIGMPERIEQAVYDGLSPAEQDEIESALPESFPDEQGAIAWGFEYGTRTEPHAFKDLVHARNAFDKLKREHGLETDSPELWALWVAEVLARLECASAEGGPAPAAARGYGDVGVTFSAPQEKQLAEIVERDKQVQRQPVVTLAEDAAAPAAAGPDGPTAFWTRVHGAKFNDKNAQKIVAAYTLDGKTDWAGALREVEAQLGRV